MTFTGSGSQYRNDNLHLSRWLTNAMTKATNNKWYEQLGFLRSVLHGLGTSSTPLRKSFRSTTNSIMASEVTPPASDEHANRRIREYHNSAAGSNRELDAADSPGFASPPQGPCEVAKLRLLQVSRPFLFLVGQAGRLPEHIQFPAQDVRPGLKPRLDR